MQRGRLTGEGRSEMGRRGGGQGRASSAPEKASLGRRDDDGVALAVDSGLGLGRRCGDVGTKNSTVNVVEAVRRCGSAMGSWSQSLELSQRHFVFTLRGPFRNGYSRLLSDKICFLGAGQSQRNLSSHWGFVEA